MSKQSVDNDWKKSLINLMTPQQTHANETTESSLTFDSELILDTDVDSLDDILDTDTNSWASCTTLESVSDVDLNDDTLSESPDQDHSVSLNTPYPQRELENESQEYKLDDEGLLQESSCVIEIKEDDDSIASSLTLCSPLSKTSSMTSNQDDDEDDESEESVESASKLKRRPIKRKFITPSPNWIEEIKALFVTEQLNLLKKFEEHESHRTRVLQAIEKERSKKMLELEHQKLEYLKKIYEKINM